MSKIQWCAIQKTQTESEFAAKINPCKISLVSDITALQIVNCLHHLTNMLVVWLCRMVESSKSHRTQLPSALTSTLELLKSLWATGGLCAPVEIKEKTGNHEFLLRLYYFSKTYLSQIHSD